MNMSDQGECWLKEMIEQVRAEETPEGKARIRAQRAEYRRLADKAAAGDEALNARIRAETLSWIEHLERAGGAVEHRTTNRIITAVWTQTSALLDHGHGRRATGVLIRAELCRLEQAGKIRKWADYGRQHCWTPGDTI